MVGGTVTGFLAVMALIILALYLARRRSNPSVRGGSRGSQDLSSQGNTTSYHILSSFGPCNLLWEDEKVF